MAESGLIVCVPEAEALVGKLRERFDASARIGVPAHITVLFPFMPSTGIDASVIRAVRAVVGKARAFEFSLATIGRFATTTYLAPDPPEPFIALTESLFREFRGFRRSPARFQRSSRISPWLTAALRIRYSRRQSCSPPWPHAAPSRRAAHRSPCSKTRRDFGDKRRSSRWLALEP